MSMYNRAWRRANKTRISLSFGLVGGAISCGAQLTSKGLPVMLTDYFMLSAGTVALCLWALNDQPNSAQKPQTPAPL